MNPTHLNRRQMLATSAAALLAPSTTLALPADTKPLFTLPQSPTLVRAFTGEDPRPQSLTRSGPQWSTSGLDLTLTPTQTETRITLQTRTPIHRVHLRWRLPIPPAASVAGDAWERSYGDLAWLPLQPDRVLPWYFLAHHASSTTGIGVKTNPAAFAFWQIDAEGISLWLDLRNGGNAVLLGDRTLAVATIVEAHGENPFHTAQTLCDSMIAGTEIPKKRGRFSTNTLYGSNDWYYAYGKNTPAGILRDAALMAELSPTTGPRPFTVIDDGYQNPATFPSLSKLASDIRSLNVEPGIWIRPTRAPKSTPSNLLLPQIHWATHTEDLAYDPTIPEAQLEIQKVVQQACDWGFDFIKHDFTTQELLGQWGFTMGASPTRPGWSFHDRTLTNAEILTRLYRDIRRTAGPDRLILGCNTVGHLAAGLFDAQRTGDDVSGRLWERTRRMGINTLAFRLPQHARFFALDADCVPITPDIPWSLTQSWLEAVAATGTVLLISPDPRAIGPDQKRAIREAFATHLTHPASNPVDWLETRTPTQWQTPQGSKHYEWLEDTGASPFPA